jgi:large subunit ribosomal protein L4|tara:strand:- start:441 stop:800 length:360 start_codon:yes stop_codon:yes gene_type:complete
MKRQSLVTVLSDKVREHQLVVVDSLAIDEPKTKEIVKLLRALNASPSVLLVADGADELTLRCARNVPRLDMSPASLLNTVDLLKHQKVVMTLEAVRKAEEIWGGPFVRRRSALQASSEE